MKDPCGPCGLCCRSYLVPLFGHDVWRIHTRRHLSPESFVFIAEQETPDALGFRLAAGGPAYGLALLKEEPLAATQPCIFLEETGKGEAGNGYFRCGIYEDRPVTCQTYPMSRLAGRVYRKETTLCPPGSWSDEDLLAPHWRESLQRLRMYRDIYVEVVARWNAGVEHWQPDPALGPGAFCDFVMAVYREITELEQATGAEVLRSVESGWARIPGRADAGGAPEDFVSRDQEPAWISHLRRVRELIDRFFPDVAPQPFQRLIVESGGTAEAG